MHLIPSGFFNKQPQATPTHLDGVILHKDFIEAIFSQLSFEELRNAASVCKKWHLISQKETLGLRIYIKFMRRILPKIEPQKMTNKEAKSHLRIHHAYSKKELECCCDLLPYRLWPLDEEKVFVIDFQSLSEQKIENSSSNLKVNINYMRTLLISKSMKYYFLKFLFWGSMTKPKIDSLYNASHIISRLVITIGSTNLTDLEKKVLLQAHETMDSYVNDQTSKIKLFSNQAPLISQFKKDAYFGY